MEAVVLGWFILTLTDSPFLVGLISAARMGMNIMALFAGAIADRVPRHKLLATVEFMMAAFAVLMLVLILIDQLETWHIFAIAVIAGMVRVFSGSTMARVGLLMSSRRSRVCAALEGRWSTCPAHVPSGRGRAVAP